MSDRLNALTRALGRSTGTWLAEHPRVRTTLLSLAGVVVIVPLMIVIGAVGDSVKVSINEARARQTWALVAVGAGDPVTLSQWASRETCEAARERTARDWFERRGVAPAVRCEGVKSWVELLNTKEKR